MHYRPEIDGLRAIAVVSVILFHAKFSAFEGGYLGVDVFFVISGYLITSILYKDMVSNNFSFKKFYYRRARRILPALYFILIICCIFAWYLLTPYEFVEFAKSLIAAALFYSNFYFLLNSDYFSIETEFLPLLHTWSLSIEEQFYIFFPLLFLFFFRYLKKQLVFVLFLFAAISLILAEWSSANNQLTSFYILPMRMWELLCGSLLAVIGDRNFSQQRSNHYEALLPLLGLVLILASVVGFNSQTRHPGLLTLIPVIGTALFIRYGTGRDIASKILSHKAVVFVGLISYSFYLWHYPVFAFARLWSTNALTPINYAILIIVSFFLSVATYKLIECPFRNSNKINNKSFLFLPISATVFVLSFGIIVITYNGIFERFNNENLVSSASNNNHEFASILSASENSARRKLHKNGKPCYKRQPSNACILGNDNLSPTWALIGDSHAGTLAYSFDIFLTNINESGLELSTSGCAYSPGFHRMDKKDFNCLNINNQIKNILSEKNIKNIIIAGRHVLYLEKNRFNNGEGGIEPGDPTGYMPANLNLKEPDRRRRVISGYKSSIENLLYNNKKIFLVYPIPEVGWNVPKALWKLRSSGSQEPLTTSLSKYFERTKNVFSAFNQIGEHQNLYRIYPHEIFCKSDLKNRCLTHLESKIFYVDDDHLSIDGANLIIDNISKEYTHKFVGKL